MYYELHGKGFPLIMIEGLSASVDSWPPDFIQELSKSFKLIIFDNRGAGRTDKPDIDYSIKMFANDTESLMDALDIEQAHVFGMSMGGLIAQELVLNYPERVEKLILCSTNSGLSKSVPPSPEVMQILTRDIEGLSGEELIRMWIPLNFPEDFIKNNPDFIEDYVRRELMSPMPLHSYKHQMSAVVKCNTRRRLKEINKPTLILQGEKDIMSPLQNAEFLEQNIPEAKLSIIPNCGHVLYAQEPKKVSKIIIEFLD